MCLFVCLSMCGKLFRFVLPAGFACESACLRVCVCVCVCVCDFGLEFAYESCCELACESVSLSFLGLLVCHCSAVASSESV